MTLTLEIARARLTDYLNREAAILKRQEYRIADRSVKFPELAEIRAGIVYWEAKVTELEAISRGRSRVRVPSPRW